MNGGKKELSKQASWALLPRLVLVSEKERLGKEYSR